MLTRRERPEGHELGLSSSTDPTSLIGQFNPKPRAICGELFDVQRRELLHRHPTANAAPRGSARLMLRYANATSSSRAASLHTSSVSLPAPRHVACPGRGLSDTWPSTTGEAIEYAAASPTDASGGAQAFAPWRKGIDLSGNSHAGRESPMPDIRFFTDARGLPAGSRDGAFRRRTLSVRRNRKILMVLASETSRPRASQGASEGVLVSGSSSSACRSSTRSTSGRMSERHGSLDSRRFHELQAGGLTRLGACGYGITVLSRPFFTTAANSSCVFRGPCVVATRGTCDSGGMS